MQSLRQASTAYQPMKNSHSENSHKPQRGRNKPLKATLTLTSLAMFFSAIIVILVLHTNWYYNHTSITGWQSYVVQAGDTVSSLAAKFDPQDYQGTVQQAIEKENHMSSSTLLVGQVVQVPVVGRKLP